MHSYIVCTCRTFRHCVFSYASSNNQPQRMHSCIAYICLTFHYCVFSNVPSNALADRMHSCIGCICLAFLHCEQHAVFGSRSRSLGPNVTDSLTDTPCWNFIDRLKSPCINTIPSNDADRTIPNPMKDLLSIVWAHFSQVFGKSEGCNCPRVFGSGIWRQNFWQSFYHDGNTIPHV